MTSPASCPPLTGATRTPPTLLPLVYEELRRLAAASLMRETSGQTLDATALVHEAYLRLIGPADDRRWKNRGPLLRRRS